jgi:hypothetical protein
MRRERGVNKGGYGSFPLGVPLSGLEGRPRKGALGLSGGMTRRIENRGAKQIQSSDFCIVISLPITMYFNTKPTWSNPIIK